MWNRRTNQQPGHCRCIRDAEVYRRGRRSNQQPGHCRCIRDAEVYRHHGRAADFFGGNGILWKECVVLPHLCKRTFKGAYVLTPARFIRPINNWGASEDFPALKNVIDRCAVTLR
ncbi:hypothetical protein TNCV_4775501 [Trichonephila clavipes]|nr:hypothetical protein TNCV_4775501 [Trichonephila clavipes]